MAKAKMKRSMRMFTGLLIGSALGAAVSLLFAPASGEETRRMIKDNVDDVKKKAESTVKNARDRVRSTVEKTEMAAIDAANDIKARAERAKDKGTPFTEEPKPFIDYEQ